MPRSPAAPGSIIAVYAAVAPESILGVTISVLGSAAVAALVGSLLLLKVSKDTGDGDLDPATADMEALKGKRSAVAGLLTTTGAGVATLTRPVKTVVFACDAGMGSSAMGASILSKKIHDAGYPDVKVVNQAIANLTDTYDIIVTHKDLANRAAPLAPSATVFTVDNFMGSPVYDDVLNTVKAANSGPTAETPATVSAADAPAAAAATAPVAAVAASLPKPRTRTPCPATPSN